MWKCEICSLCSPLYNWKHRWKFWKAQCFIVCTALEASRTSTLYEMGLLVVFLLSLYYWHFCLKIKHFWLKKKITCHSTETFDLGDKIVSKHFSAHACSPVSLCFLNLLILLFFLICSVIFTFVLHLCKVTATNVFYYFQNTCIGIYIMINK